MHYKWWGKKIIENSNIIKKGLVVAVIFLFIGLALSSSITANVGELSEYNTLEEISTIIEENDDIRAYIEMKSDEDCGCNDESSELEWNSPVLCALLFPIYFFIFYIYGLSHRTIFTKLLLIMIDIGSALNCFW